MGLGPGRGERTERAAQDTLLHCPEQMQQRGQVEKPCGFLKANRRQTPPAAAPTQWPSAAVVTLPGRQ